jgi:heat shock protein HtpX
VCCNAPAKRAEVIAMEQAFGLYTHIRSNKRRSVALLIGLFLLVYVMVYAGALVAEVLTGDAPLDYLLRAALRDFIAALPWATLGTILWIFIAYYFHQSMIDAITGGYEVSRREEPRLWNILENLCISRGLTMPKLKVVDSDALNAFASGLNQRQYSISVTRGLLERLEDPEIEAVLGHELTHIRNGDVRMLVIAVVIAGVIAFFAELIVRMFFQTGLYWRGRRRDSDSRGGGGAGIAIVIAIALIAIAWLLSVMIRFALSRSREFLADAGSVELTKNPDAMITALRKIEGRGDLERANSAVMEMCIDNPRHDFANLFDTHPPIEKRIEALVQYAGGHDPGPIALPAPAEEGAEYTGEPEPGGQSEAGGPWGGGEKPFLPERPPIELGGEPRPGGPWGSNQPPDDGGPWGPHRR